MPATEPHSHWMSRQFLHVSHPILAIAAKGFIDSLSPSAAGQLHEKVMLRPLAAMPSPIARQPSPNDGEEPLMNDPSIRTLHASILM